MNIIALDNTKKIVFIKTFHKKKFVSFKRIAFIIIIIIIISNSIRNHGNKREQELRQQ